MRRSVCWSAAAYILAAVLMMSIRTASDGGPERCCTPWCPLGGHWHGDVGWLQRQNICWLIGLAASRTPTIARGPHRYGGSQGAAEDGLHLQQLPRWAHAATLLVLTVRCCRCRVGNGHGRTASNGDILPDVRDCICTTPADVNRGTESVPTDDGCGTAHCQCSVSAARLR